MGGRAVLAPVRAVLIRVVRPRITASVVRFCCVPRPGTATMPCY